MSHCQHSVLLSEDVVNEKKIQNLYQRYKNDIDEELEREVGPFRYVFTENCPKFKK